MEERTPDNQPDSDPPRRRRFRLRVRFPRLSKWLWLAAGAGLVTIGVGFGGGYLSAQLAGDGERLSGEMEQLSREVDELRKVLGVGGGDGAAAAPLDTGVADLGLSITDRVLNATRATGTERTIRSIEAVAARFETDRLLLAEMRKSPPQDAVEARRYWFNIKPLAAKSDPRLAPMVDRVEGYLPAYLEWVDAPSGSEQAAVLGFVRSGASNYLRAVDEFWQAVLLVVIDRIDVLVGLTLG